MSWPEGPLGKVAKLAGNFPKICPKVGQNWAKLFKIAQNWVKMGQNSVKWRKMA